MRILYCGSGVFARSVFDALEASSHRLVGVVTAPPKRRGRGLQRGATPVGEAALAAGLPLATPERWDAPLLDWIRGLAPDAVAVADYGVRVPVKDLPGAVNVHPSLLPRWRGAAPVQRAILQGDEETGVSVIRLVEALDAGPVYARRTTPIGADETAGDLLLRLAKEGGTLLVSVLDRLERGEIEPQPQDPSGVTTAPKIKPDETRVDPAREGVDALRRRVRALAPRPGVHVGLLGRQVTLLALGERCSGPPPGEADAASGALLLGCADGAVEVRRLKPAGGREMDGRAFANGLRGVRP